MELYKARFGGMERLFGDTCLEKLHKAHVCIIGIGGVGTWAAESLARSGIGNFTLVDLDDICITNTNRQLHAVHNNLGCLKTDAMAERMRSINPEININCVNEFVSPANVKNILNNNIDFVIDAIDSTVDKCAIIMACRELKIKYIISGGAGGKIDATRVNIADLGKTQADGLLKALKKMLKSKYNISANEHGLFNITCVYSSEPALMPWNVCAAGTNTDNMRLNCASGLGSASFVTGVFGLAMAGYAVQAILS